jgi:hypothetical protein
VGFADSQYVFGNPSERVGLDGTPKLAPIGRVASGEAHGPEADRSGNGVRGARERARRGARRRRAERGLCHSVDLISIG